MSDDELVAAVIAALKNPSEKTGGWGREDRQARAVIPIVAREVVARAAQAAEGCCRCHEAFKDRGLDDPSCMAHDVADVVSALPLPGGGS